MAYIDVIADEFAQRGIKSLVDIAQVNLEYIASEAERIGNLDLAEAAATQLELDELDQADYIGE